VPGRTKPGKTTKATKATRATARKRPSDRDTATAAAGRRSANQEADQAAVSSRQGVREADGAAVSNWPGDQEADEAVVTSRPSDREVDEAPVSNWTGGPEAEESALAGWPGDREAAPGWPQPDWAVPGETVVPDGTDEPAAGEWAGGEDTARDKTAGGEWFGGEEAARAACLRLLTSAPRTRAQLAAALRRRRVPDEIAESVLARFAEVGLIDDAAFARAWVESRHHSRGLARKALAAELRQRGIADGEVRAAVDTLGPQDEMAAARWLVLKRMAATRGRPLPTRARQLLGMLARKGYSAGLAAQVVREALEQEEADDPDARVDLALICEDSAGSDWP
jgi:regulatory protein